MSSVLENLSLKMIEASLVLIHLLFEISDTGKNSVMSINLTMPTCWMC